MAHNSLCWVNGKSSKEFREILEYIATETARDMFSSTQKVHETEKSITWSNKITQIQLNMIVTAAF